MDCFEWPNQEVSLQTASFLWVMRCCTQPVSLSVSLSLCVCNVCRSVPRSVIVVCVEASLDWDADICSPNFQYNITWLMGSFHLRRDSCHDYEYRFFYEMHYPITCVWKCWITQALQAETDSPNNKVERWHESRCRESICMSDSWLRICQRRFCLLCNSELTSRGFNSRYIWLHNSSRSAVIK